MNTRWIVSKTPTTEQEKIMDMSNVEHRVSAEFCQPFYDEYVRLLITQGRCVARNYLTTLMPLLAKVVDAMLCDDGIQIKETSGND